MRRGQVTLFVIIGLILLITLLFLFLLRGAIMDAFEPRGTSAYDTALVEGYVGSCIDLVTEEGVALLAEHGGVIYEEYGGLHTKDARTLEEQNIFPNSLERTFNPAFDWPLYSLENGDRPGGTSQAPAPHQHVSFGLVRKSGASFGPPEDCRPCASCAGTCDNRLEAPDYPWPNDGWSSLADLQGPSSPLSEYIRRATAVDRKSDGPYGEYALPMLCDPNGPNRNTLENRNLRCREIDHIPGRVHGPSIQRGLKAYIDLKLTECIDEDRLSQSLGASVTRGAPNASVILTANRLTVALQLPLIFAQDSSTRLGEFTRSFDIRLHTLYSFIYFLLEEAAKDPTARIDDPDFYSGVREWDGFIVNQRRLPFAAGHRNDLIMVTVTDQYSSVQRNALNFRFLIENRPPILEPLNGELSLLPYENEPFPWVVPINALDPDGDRVDVRLEFPRNILNRPTPPYDSYNAGAPSPRINQYPAPQGYDERGQHAVDITGIACPAPQEGPCLLVNEVPANLTVQNVRLVVNDTKPVAYPQRRNDFAHGQDWELVTLRIGDTHS